MVRDYCSGEPQSSICKPVWVGNGVYDGGRDACAGRVMVAHVLVLEAFRVQYADGHLADFRRLSEVYDEGLSTFTRTGAVVEYAYSLS